MLDADTICINEANAGSGNKPFIFKLLTLPNFTYVVGPNDVDTGIDATIYQRSLVRFRNRN